jgi:hypothetical protein
VSPQGGWSGDQIIGLIALVLSSGALLYAGRQFYHGRRATAGASLISIQESFRQAWARFTDTLKMIMGAGTAPFLR